jgi:hypothetical protein
MLYPNVATPAPGFSIEEVLISCQGQTPTLDCVATLKGIATTEINFVPA